jgi:DnaJ-class molecular chaperone
MTAEDRTCPACNGTGRVNPDKIEQHLLMYPTIEMRWQVRFLLIEMGPGILTCPNCAGSGQCEDCKEHS